MEDYKGAGTSVSAFHGDPGARDDHRGLLQSFRSLSGREMMERLLRHEDPRDVVRRLPPGDVYWMLKKLDEETAVLLLGLASEAQWQYMLDLELWVGDRLDSGRSALWMRRLAQADCPRLVRWLFSEGQALAYYHFFRNLEVLVVQSEEDLLDLPRGCFSVDGIYYLRAAREEDRPALEHILGVMAQTDYSRYQALLQGLGGVIPAELEEDMYRMRNVRIAEHGFLPREEALAVYAPLDPQTLEGSKDEVYLQEAPLDDSEADALVPVTPLEHAGRGELLLEAAAGSRDSLLLDRVRLEFAGLCNQILSAEGDFSPELETLEATCERAASYLNLALERLGGRDKSATEHVLRRHSLLSLFRVGFGLALKLKWEAVRWKSTSWFAEKELAPEFWGEYWGGVLAGLVQPRPRVFEGHGGGEDYRDFERLSDLADCLKVLRRIMVLDGLMERLCRAYPLEAHVLGYPELSFRPLLFNLWARRVLEEAPSLSPLTQAQFNRFFEAARAGEEKKGPPYRMPGSEEAFVSFFMAHVRDSDQEARDILQESLVLVWQEFEEEYAWVQAGDLDPKYSKFFLVKGPKSSSH